MKATWRRDNGALEFAGEYFQVTCNVRNEIDSRFIRKLHDPKEVIYAIVRGKSTNIPYMPRKFPLGTWEILKIESSDDPIFAPFKIRTDAQQKVAVWSLDTKGGYDKATDQSVLDGGYLLHASSSNTTHGCGRISSKEQATLLADLIAKELVKGPVYLEVI